MKRKSDLEIVTKWLNFLIAVITLIGGVASFIAESLHPQESLAKLSNFQTLALLVPIGLLAGVLHGLLWAGSEKVFGWKFGAGGGKAMPSGLSAIILAITLTFPLVFVPIIFQRLSAFQILPSNHIDGALALMVAGAVGHVAMYGLSPSLPGLRNLLMPVGTEVALARALLTECIYGIVYFSLMGFAYHVFSGPLMKLPSAGDVGAVAGSALAFILGMAVFIIARLPESIRNLRWIEVRGFYSGIYLPMCLSAAILL